MTATAPDAAPPPAARPGVPPWQRRYLIATTAIVGWALGYALAAWSQWPRVMYDPLRRAWLVRARPGSPVPIDYWGLMLYGASGAAVGGAAALLALAAWRRPVPARVLNLLGAWAITAFVLGGGYFMWTLLAF
ncbi:MAG: hypothetical protein H6709_02705 [Kofleriaceae bacterium]|nr:hypothetical protein [Kofleriaceae bacterium]